jgi:hypothetical protein
MCYYNYIKFPSYEICRCAVDYKQRRQLLKRNRAAQQQAKLLAAARPLLEVALASDRGRGASPAAEDTTPPPGEPSESPPSHIALHRRKRPISLADIPVARGGFPCKFVSPQLLNSKGEQIFYPVMDDTDRSWARRLEWAIECHRDLAEADLDGLQAEYERVLRTSRQAVGRRDDRLYIKSLQEQLECAHKRFRNLRMP